MLQIIYLQHFVFENGYKKPILAAVKRRSRVFVR
jgi:hypothetical protein